MCRVVRCASLCRQLLHRRGWMVVLAGAAMVPVATASSAAQGAPSPAASPIKAGVEGTISMDSLPQPAKSATPAASAAPNGTLPVAAPATQAPPPSPPTAAAAAAAQDSSPGGPVPGLDGSGSIPLDRVVAIVGDEPVLWSSVLERINVGRAQGVLKIPSDSAGQMAVALKVTNDLVDEELLVQKAKELKVEVTDDDVALGVDDQLKRVREAYPSATEYRAALKQAGYGSPEEYRRALVDQQKRALLERKVIEKLKQDGKLLPVGVTEAEVDTAFQANKAQLPKKPATVTFRQMVIAPRPTPAAKAAARAKIDSIYVELKKLGPSAEQFASVARRESMDATREQGGDLGWTRRGIMVPEFERWMFAIPPGTISPVIETVFGFHIIRVDRVKPTEVKASHILIRWKLDSAREVAARREADSVLAAWKAGVSFDTLVLHHHDPNEEKGSLLPFPRDSLPATYTAAFLGQPAGEFVGPFAIADKGTGRSKYVIAQLITVEDGGDFTLDDWRTRFRDQLAEERSIARLLQTLRKESYVSIRL